jgi:hypothetical protein
VFSIKARAKPQPNKAVEPTAPMVAVWPAGAVQGAAAHRERWAAARGLAEVPILSRCLLESCCQEAQPFPVRGRAIAGESDHAKQPPTDESNGC